MRQTNLSGQVRCRWRLPGELRKAEKVGVTLFCPWHDINGLLIKDCRRYQSTNGRMRCKAIGYYDRHPTITIRIDAADKGDMAKNTPSNHSGAISEGAY